MLTINDFSGKKLSDNFSKLLSIKFINRQFDEKGPKVLTINRLIISAHLRLLYEQRHYVHPGKNTN
jgi:hypothetical protein